MSTDGEHSRARWRTDGKERAEAEVGGEQTAPHFIAGHGRHGGQIRARARVQREARLHVQDVDERHFAQLGHHVDAQRQQHRTTHLDAGTRRWRRCKREWKETQILSKFSNK